MAKTDFSKINADIQAAEKRKKALENGEFSKKFEKTEWMKLPFGDTTFMVLPPFNDDAHIYLEVYVHHNFTNPADPDKKRSYLCSKKNHGSCPLCDHVEELTKRGETKLAGQLRAQRTFLYNVMDAEGNVKVAPLKPSMHTEVRQEINTQYIDEDVDVTDPANGKLIKLSRLKAAPWARARVLGKTMELSANKIEEVKSKIKDLTTVYFDFTPEDLQRALNGEDLYPKKTKGNSEELSEDLGDGGTEEVAETKPVATKKAQTTAATTAKPAATKTETKPAAKAEVKKEAEVTAPKESTGDDELDAMLNDLGME